MTAAENFSQAIGALCQVHVCLHKRGPIILSSRRESSRGDGAHGVLRRLVAPTRVPIPEHDLVQEYIHGGILDAPRIVSDRELAENACEGRAGRKTRKKENGPRASHLPGDGTFAIKACRALSPEIRAEDRVYLRCVVEGLNSQVPA